MSVSYDVAAIGNAIVDVISPAEDAFLAANELVKGSMMLIDEQRAHDLYGRMGQAIETSGGSAGNTVAGVASLGGRAAYFGKVATDQLGEVYVIGVDPAAAGGGLGKALLGAGLTYLRSRGNSRVELYVESDHPTAIGLYLGAGFSESSRDALYRTRA